jgi:hypothetical protein
MLRGSACALLLVVLGDLAFSEGFWTLPAYLVVVALAIGYRTRAAAGLCAAVSLWLLFRWPTVSPVLIVTHVMDALALMLLGPGAISIDAHLYGRRVISTTSTRH